MSTVTELLARANALPTFFGVDQESELLGNIMSLPVDEINAEMPEFLALLDRLIESHTVGSGYMLVTPANKDTFREFLSWARRNDGLLNTGPTRISDLVADLDLDASILPQLRRDLRESHRASNG